MMKNKTRNPQMLSSSTPIISKTNKNKGISEALIVTAVGNDVDSNDKENVHQDRSKKKAGKSKNITQQQQQQSSSVAISTILTADNEFEDQFVLPALLSMDDDEMVIKALEGVKKWLDTLKQRASNAEEPAIDAFAKKLLSPHLMSNQNQEIQSVCACCVAGILNHYAPSEEAASSNDADTMPYSDPEMKIVFEFVFNQISADLLSDDAKCHENAYYSLRMIRQCQVVKILPSLEQNTAKRNEFIKSTMECLIEMRYENKNLSNKHKRCIADIIVDLVGEPGVLYSDEDLIYTLLSPLVPGYQSASGDVSHPGVNELIREVVFSLGKERYHRARTEVVTALNKCMPGFQNPDLFYAIVDHLHAIDPTLVTSILPSTGVIITSAEPEKHRLPIAKMLGNVFRRSTLDEIRANVSVFSSFMSLIFDVHESIRLNMIHFVGYSFFDTNSSQVMSLSGNKAESSRIFILTPMGPEQEWSLDNMGTLPLIGKPESGIKSENTDDIQLLIDHEESRDSFSTTGSGMFRKRRKSARGHSAGTKLFGDEIDENDDDDANDDDYLQGPATASARKRRAGKRGREQRTLRPRSFLEWALQDSSATIRKEVVGLVCDLAQLPDGPSYVSESLLRALAKRLHDSSFDIMMRTAMWLSRLFLKHLVPALNQDTSYMYDMSDDKLKSLMGWIPDALMQSLFNLKLSTNQIMEYKALICDLFDEVLLGKSGQVTSKGRAKVLCSIWKHVGIRSRFAFEKIFFEERRQYQMEMRKICRAISTRDGGGKREEAGTDAIERMIFGLLKQCIAGVSESSGTAFMEALSSQSVFDCFQTLSHPSECRSREELQMVFESAKAEINASVQGVADVVFKRMGMFTLCGEDIEALMEMVKDSHDELVNIKIGHEEYSGFLDCACELLVKFTDAFPGALAGCVNARDHILWMLAPPETKPRLSQKLIVTACKVLERQRGDDAVLFNGDKNGAARKGIAEALTKIALENLSASSKRDSLMDPLVGKRIASALISVTEGNETLRNKSIIGILNKFDKDELELPMVRILATILKHSDGKGHSPSILTAIDKYVRMCYERVQQDPTRKSQDIQARAYCFKVIGFEVVRRLANGSVDDDYHSVATQDLVKVVFETLVNLRDKNSALDDDGQVLLSCASALMRIYSAATKVQLGEQVLQPLFAKTDIGLLQGAGGSSTADTAMNIRRMVWLELGRVAMLFQAGIPFRYAKKVFRILLSQPTKRFDTFCSHMFAATRSQYDGDEMEDMLKSTIALLQAHSKTDKQQGQSRVEWELIPRVLTLLANHQTLSDRGETDAFLHHYFTVVISNVLERVPNVSQKALLGQLDALLGREAILQASQPKLGAIVRIAREVCMKHYSKSKPG